LAVAELPNLLEERMCVRIHRELSRILRLGAREIDQHAGAIRSLQDEPQPWRRGGIRIVRDEISGLAVILRPEIFLEEA